jgi:hypothetical protein
MRHSNETTNRVQLVVTGKPVGRRFEVIVNERSVLLSGNSFYYLFRLAHHVATAPGDYLQHSELDSGDNHIRYIYRLRQELKANQVDSQLWIENDKKGGYRLMLSLDQINLDLNQLSEYPDVRVETLVKALDQQNVATTVRQ